MRPPRAREERTGWSDLSRMKGNFHVRFLEGGGPLTARLYSAGTQGGRSPVRWTRFGKSEFTPIVDYQDLKVY